MVLMSVLWTCSCTCRSQRTCGFPPEHFGVGCCFGRGEHKERVLENNNKKRRSVVSARVDCVVRESRGKIGWECLGAGLTWKLNPAPLWPFSSKCKSSVLPNVFFLTLYINKLTKHILWHPKYARAWHNADTDDIITYMKNFFFFFPKVKQKTTLM